MKKASLILCFLTSLFIFGCCSNISKKEDTQKQTPPASIQENRSLIEAEVIEINKSSGSDYKLKAKILSIEQDGAYPSIAVVGNTYELTPGYVMGDTGEIDFSAERNKNLREISDLKNGDKFNAEIYMNDNKHWIIRSKRN